MMVGVLDVSGRVTGRVMIGQMMRTGLVVRPPRLVMRRRGHMHGRRGMMRDRCPHVPGGPDPVVDIQIVVRCGGRRTGERDEPGTDQQ